MKSSSIFAIFGMSLVAGMVQAATPPNPPAEVHIPGVGVFPESITSSSDGSIFVGSPGARTIFRARPGDASAASWIAPGTDGIQAIFGVFADNKSQTLWACSNANGPPGAAPARPAALYAFGLADGKLKGQYPLPTARAMCNDIAVGPDGSAFATDTSNMQVLRLKPGSAALEVWAGDGAYGPAGGVLDGIAVLGTNVLVNTLANGKIFSTQIKSDGSAGATSELKLDRAIAQPDGMRSFGKNGLLVAEGGGGGRLTYILVNGDAGTVKTLREGFPDGPVAVTVVGEKAYVLEGQLMAMMRPDPNAPPKPFKATAVQVGRPD